MGSGTLFDGVNGIPARPRAITAYERGAGTAIDPIVSATGRKKTKKRKTTKNKAITYNF
jgi:hypothetical protein